MTTYYPARRYDPGTNGFTKTPTTSTPGGTVSASGIQYVQDEGTTLAPTSPGMNFTGPLVKATVNPSTGLVDVNIAFSTSAAQSDPDESALPGTLAYWPYIAASPHSDTVRDVVGGCDFTSATLESADLYRIYSGSRHGYPEVPPWAYNTTAAADALHDAAIDDSFWFACIVRGYPAATAAHVADATVYQPLFSIGSNNGSSLFYPLIVALNYTKALIYWYENPSYVLEEIDLPEQWYKSDPGPHLLVVNRTHDTTSTLRVWWDGVLLDTITSLANPAAAAGVTQRLVYLGSHLAGIGAATFEDVILPTDWMLGEGILSDGNVADYWSILDPTPTVENGHSSIPGLGAVESGHTGTANSAWTFAGTGASQCTPIASALTGPVANAIPKLDATGKLPGTFITVDDASMILSGQVFGRR